MAETLLFVCINILGIFVGHRTKLIFRYSKIYPMLKDSAYEKYCGNFYEISCIDKFITSSRILSQLISELFLMFDEQIYDTILEVKFYDVFCPKKCTFILVFAILPNYLFIQVDTFPQRYTHLNL